MTRAISVNNFVYSKAAVSLGSKKAFLFNRVNVFFNQFLLEVTVHLKDVAFVESLKEALFGKTVEKSWTLALF